MNPVALAQSQNFFTLLQALAAAGASDAALSVEARLIALAGDGTATAEIAGRSVTLQLDGPQAKQAALQPGATLVLKLAPPDAGETASRATLVEIRPPAGPPSPLPPLPGLPQSSPTAAAPGAASIAAPPALSPALAPAPATRATLADPAITASLAPKSAPSAQLQAPSPAEIRNQIGPMLSAAIGRQDGLAPLLANLRSLTEGAVSLTVPRALLQHAESLLRRALPGDAPLTAPQLREAVRSSGVFHEARQVLAAAPASDRVAASANALPQPGAVQTPMAPRPVANPNDIKTQLVLLREASADLVDRLAPKSAPVPSEPAAARAVPTERSHLPPPRRDSPLPAQSIAEPTLAQGERPLAIAETLLRQSEAALDRLTLTQFASLPPDQPRSEAQAPQRWLLEIPLAFQNGHAVMPIEIEREPPRRDSEGIAGPAWQMRFALDIEPLGPLQGYISLRGRSVGVTLWAEREPTTRLLLGAAPDLEAALLGAAFESGSVDVRSGQPAVRQATAGQFFDRVS